MLERTQTIINRNTKLLSFGQDADREEEQEITFKKKNITRPDREEFTSQTVSLVLNHYIYILKVIHPENCPISVPDIIPHSRHSSSEGKVVAKNIPKVCLTNEGFTCYSGLHAGSAEAGNRSI